MQDIFKKQFANLNEITGLPFKRKGSRLISATYINGDAHPRCDKTYAQLKSKGVYIKEQGSLDLSLPEWLALYGDESKLKIEGGRESLPEMKQAERIFVDPIHVESTVPARYSGNLFTFLSTLFGAEKVTGVFHRYNVGEDGNNTIYWYMNELGGVCHDARIAYGVNGKREKDRGGWRRHQVDMGYNAKCVFGAHLLPLYESENVCVVESEKACLIMALVETKGRLWVSVGGDQKIFMARDEWKRYGDFDDAGRGWKGEEWWKGLEVLEGDGPDDFVIRKMMKR